MKQKMSTAMIAFMGLSLLIYTASRTLNFISLTLPSSAQITGYFALVSFDGGVLLWPYFYLHGARGPWQRGIALLMTIVDLVGVIVAFAADTLWTATGKGMAQMTPEAAQTAIYLMVIIIAANISAYVFNHLVSPDALRAQKHEEANDKIFDATLDQIGQNAVQLAAEVAPKLAADWQQRTRQQHLDAIEQVPPKVVLAPARLNAEVDVPEPEIVPVAARKNGHRPNS